MSLTRRVLAFIRLRLWIFRSKNVALAPTRGVQRRESFLYRKQLSYPPRFENESIIPLDDEIVTPFAQILATLQDVRTNLSVLMVVGGIGESGRTSHLYKSESMSCVWPADKNSCLKYYHKYSLCTFPCLHN